MIHDPTPFLTVKELANRLRVSLATAYVLVRQGSIASHRIGSCRGAIRIREADLEAYLTTTYQQRIASKTKTAPARIHLKHLKLK